MTKLTLIALTLLSWWPDWLPFAEYVGTWN